ncbi:MAG: hypothetical protein SF123_21800 [Chloroflexota bacterium]|nr:hypothetical protein [Chloroflexota bacterium]
MLTICFWAQAKGEQGEFNAGQSAEIEIEADWDQYMMFAAQQRYPHLVAAWDELCQRLIAEGWDLVTKEEMDNWWTYAFRRHP